MEEVVEILGTLPLAGTSWSQPCELGGWFWRDALVFLYGYLN